MQNEGKIHMNSEKTKKCKYCKSEIPADARICPQCRKKVKGGKLKWIFLLLVILMIAGAASGGKKESSKGSKSAGSSGEKITVTPITYLSVSVDDMVAELEDNALNASDHYKDTYLEITGKLSNIDSSGKYINLDPVNSDFSIYGVQCYLSDDAQRNAISNMKKGDTITLKGQCTDVGEVLGYSLDIDEIE